MTGPGKCHLGPLAICHSELVGSTAGISPLALQFVPSTPSRTPTPCYKSSDRRADPHMRKAALAAGFRSHPCRCLADAKPPSRRYHRPSRPGRPACRWEHANDLRPTPPAESSRYGGTALCGCKFRSGPLALVLSATTGEVHGCTWRRSGSPSPAPQTQAFRGLTTSTVRVGGESRKTAPRHLRHGNDLTDDWHLVRHRRVPDNRVTYSSDIPIGRPTG